MSYLYGGNILRIDLDNNEIKKIPTSKYAEKYVGGRGINARIIYEEVGPGVDPLSPENLIAFGVGPLTGTLFPGSSRVDIMAKSPVTKLLGDANMGGDWGAEFKYAGYDNLVIKGKAEKPVYIFIENEKIEIRDAGHLWGLESYELQKQLQEELNDPETKVLGIGPAGENCVKFASIQTNVGNAAARTGMGAVLGSKNVKAIAVRGTKGVQVADPKKFFEACTEAHQTIRNADYYGEVSTTGVTEAEYSYVLSGMEASGDAHKTAENFDSEGKTDFLKFWEKYKFKRTGCFGCPVHCMENYDVPGLGGTVISCEVYPQLTWEVRNNDMLLFYECVRICQKCGLDNTSIAMTLAWLMDLYEQGILLPEHTDGIAMEWGSRDAIFTMMNKTIYREGFGDFIADGMDAVAAKLDELIPEEKRNFKSTKDYAMQVNNNPMYGINPRMNSMALSYAVGRRSDCITDLDIIQFYMIASPVYPGWTEEDKKANIEFCSKEAERITGLKEAADPYSYNGKAAMVSDMGVPTTIVDMVGTCKWHTQWLYLDITPKHIAKAISAGLGKEVTTEDLIHASFRVKLLERSYECIEGRRRFNDIIPEKEFDNPVSRGPWKGMVLKREKFEKMKDEYYNLRGWDLETGIPTVKALQKYNLDDVVKKLEDLKLIPGKLEASA